MFKTKIDFVRLVVIMLLALAVIGAGQPLAAQETPAVPDDVQEKLDELVAGGYIPDAGNLLLEPTTEQVENDQVGSQASLFLEDIETRDVVVQADITWSSDDRKSGCGFIARHKDDRNFNEMVLLRAGVLNFYTWIAGTQYLDFWRLGSTFDLTDGGTNRLLLVMNDRHYTVFINDELVRDYGASRFRDLYPGGVALLAEGDVTCEFDNLWVWEIEGGGERTIVVPPAEEAAEPAEEAAEPAEEVVCVPLEITGLWYVLGGCVEGEALWDRAVNVSVTGGDGVSFDYYWGDQLLLEGAGPEVSLRVFGYPDQEAIIDWVRVESCGMSARQELYITRPEGGDQCTAD